MLLQAPQSVPGLAPRVSGGQVGLLPVLQLPVLQLPVLQVPGGLGPPEGRRQQRQPLPVRRPLILEIA